MPRLRGRVQFNDTMEGEGILREAISIPMDTRLRIQQNTNGSGLRFRALLSAGCAPMLEVARGHRIPPSLLSQRNRAVSERLRRRRVVSGDPKAITRRGVFYLSALSVGFGVMLAA
jgi:hypothetical protein